MRRLRFLRILLPAALVLFLTVLVVSLRERPPVHGAPTTDGVEIEPSATGVVVRQIVGQETALDFVADIVEPQPDGGYHLERIERLGIAQEDKAPLVIQARSAEIEGPEGSRKIIARDQVVVTDAEDGLVLTLPRLDIDEAKSEATSSGEIVLEGAGVSGRASRLIYSLAGEPSELFELVLEDATGARLSAQKAVLLDGLDDVELRDEVRADRGEEHLEADWLRVRRDEQGQVRKAVAEGNVDGRVLAAPETLADVAGRYLEADWDAQGELESALLRGDASLASGGESVTAATIRAERAAGAAIWKVTAEGTVYAQGQFGEGPAWIRAERLDAEMDPQMQLRGAEAKGDVRFEGTATRAEADRAVFDPAQGLGEIRLFAEGNRKARLGRERTRVAAEQITTDQQGIHLLAERRVEATLLPGGDVAEGSSVDGLFESEQAIHFVAASLEGRDSGDTLVFRTGVRGWQGERNLSADIIEMTREDTSLHAQGNVTTRLPRETDGAALTEADFVQISADSLKYDGNARVAVYTGNVRVNLVEGWMEARRIEVHLADGDEGGMREVRAHDDVRIEFRDPDAEQVPEFFSGTADRASYVPGKRTVWLYGDEKPASVRRLGGQGATTSGRVLRYELDVGTLEVQSGEQAPARIRGR